MPIRTQIWRMSKKYNLSVQFLLTSAPTFVSTQLISTPKINFHSIVNSPKHRYNKPHNATQKTKKGSDSAGQNSEFRPAANLNELNIAKTLVSKRREKGITQEELAAYIGVSKASVSKWETAQSYPDITFLPQLAAYFNISVDELIDYHPQMIKEDIKKLYLRLSNDFTKKPFDEVMDEIREIQKKYFSCFPLLFHMGMLRMNHFMLAKESKQPEIIREAIDIFARIKSESSDFTLCRQSNVMEAACYLILSDPAKIIDLLEGSETLPMNENLILAMGYSMNGRMEKAKEILQAEIYQNLLSILQNLTALLQLEATNPQASQTIMERIGCLSDAFDAARLHPATMLTAYLNFAVAFAAQNDTERALSALQKYCDLAAGISYPVTLHGDGFFDKIDGWLSKLNLGIHAPRDDQTVKQGIVQCVADNPAFQHLSENLKYKHIVEKLNTILNP